MSPGKDRQPELFGKSIGRTRGRDSRIGLVLIALGAVLLVVAVIGALAVNL